MLYYLHNLFANYAPNHVLETIKEKDKTFSVPIICKIDDHYIAIKNDSYFS